MYEQHPLLLALRALELLAIKHAMLDGSVSHTVWSRQETARLLGRRRMYLDGELTEWPRLPSVARRLLARFSGPSD